MFGRLLQPLKTIQPQHEEPYHFIVSRSVETSTSSRWLTAFLFLNMLSGIVRAEKHPAMQVYENDLHLYHLVQDLEIIYDPEQHVDVGVEIEKYTEVSTAMTINLRHNLAFSMNTDVLKKILVQNPFSIHIVSPRSTQDHSASYDYTKHVIKIAWNENFQDSEMRKILQNEIHHAATCAKNNKKTVDCLYMPNSEALIKAIEDGSKKIAQYQIKFNSGQYQEEFEKLSEKMTDYEPHVWDFTIPLRAYEIISAHSKFKKLADGRHVIPKEAMSGAPIDILKKNDCYLIAIKGKTKDTVTLKISFSKNDSAHSKMRAFFLDAEYRRYFYQSTPHVMGGYANDGFFKLNAASKASELASDVEMLPPDLKRLFFPKFCKMFSSFHEVEKYCERPVPKKVQCKA